MFPNLKGYESIHDDQVQVKKKSLLTHEPQALQPNTGDPLSHETMSSWVLTQVARFAFACLDLGDCRSPDFLKQSFSTGNWVLRCLVPSFWEGSKMRGGEGIISMQYLRSLVLKWLWSAQDFPSRPHPPPCHSGGSVFPLAELYLGLPEAKSHSSPSFSTHTNSQVAAGLGILSISPLCAVNATVRWYDLHEHKSELGVGQHGLFLLWQPNHPGLTDAYKWIRTFSLGPLPFSRH